MIDLKSILQQCPNCISSRASFKAVLMDKYPSEKRMGNILTILLECGVASKIKAKKNIDANEMQMLIAQLENEYGISGQYSQDAILIWAAAFGVTASAIKLNTPETASSNNTDATVPKPVVYVQGDIDDYNIVQKADGYYITQFNGFEEDEMTIPSMIDGKAIIGIAQDAFKGCVAVKRVVVSEGIEIIENKAFKDCKSLENILLPNTLKRIGSDDAKERDGAFACTNLRSILIPNTTEYVGPYTFASCENLQQVQMSDNIIAIEKGTFYYCHRLRDVTLPKELLVIEEDAFTLCLGLKEIRIPIGTQELKKCAFANTKMSAIHVPPTVTKIGWCAFVNSPTVYCVAGSAAMEFARQNNMKCAKAQF